MLQNVKGAEGISTHTAEPLRKAQRNAVHSSCSCPPVPALPRRGAHTRVCARARPFRCLFPPPPAPHRRAHRSPSPRVDSSCPVPAAGLSGGGPAGGRGTPRMRPGEPEPSPSPEMTQPPLRHRLPSGLAPFQELRLPPPPSSQPSSFLLLLASPSLSNNPPPPDTRSPPPPQTPSSGPRDAGEPWRAPPLSISKRGEPPGAVRQPRGVHGGDAGGAVRAGGGEE